jgi:hypothetical protein
MMFPKLQKETVVDEQKALGLAGFCWNPHRKCEAAIKKPGAIAWAR